MGINVFEYEAQQPQVMNHQRFKLCASGTGVIVYQELDYQVRVLLAMRSKNVGRGLGVTGGGFVECADIDKALPDSLFQTSDQAYREMCEENPGFEFLIDADDFIERAQPISLVHARVDDINRVHSAAMFALRVTDSEWRKIAALDADDGPDAEREGYLREYLMHWDSKIDRREPEKCVRVVNRHGEPATYDHFWHKHELHTIACIAWHAQNNRLW